MLAAATFLLWAASAAGTAAQLIAVAAYVAAAAYVVRVAPPRRRVATVAVLVGVTALGAGLLLTLGVVVGLPGAGVVTGVVAALLVAAGGRLPR
jgi:hypothetical protein